MSFAPADVDGDGDLDVVAGNATQPNQLFLRSPAGELVDVSSLRIPSFLERYDELVLADVDGDGDDDVLLAGYGVQNRLYENDGTAAFSDTTHRLPVDALPTSDVAAGDVDGDGDLDVYFANRSGSFAPGGIDQDLLYENDGTGTFTDATANLPADDARDTAAEFGDVDGDGDLDVLIGSLEICDPDCSGDQTRLYTNDGTGVFSDATANLPVDGEETGDAILVDVDGDGDLDAVLANGRSDESNRLYVNDGNGVFTDAGGELAAAFDFSYDVDADDVDADGDQDLFFVNISTQDRLYVNDGAGVFTDAPAQVPSALDYTSHAAFVDIDLDGDRDLVVTGAPKLLLNDGTGSFFDASGLLPPILGGADIAFADLDNDGDPDGITSGIGQHLYLHLARQVVHTGAPRLGRRSTSTSTARPARPGLSAWPSARPGRRSRPTARCSSIRRRCRRSREARSTRRAPPRSASSSRRCRASSGCRCSGRPSSACPSRSRTSTGRC